MSICNYRAPNGEPSLLYQEAANRFGPAEAEQIWYLTKTQEFRDWFGNSKMVDENGEPKIYYHLSASQFDRFDVSKIKDHTAMNWIGQMKKLFMQPAGNGFFFSETIDYQKNWYKASERPYLYPVFLKVENPHYTNNFDDFYFKFAKGDGTILTHTKFFQKGLKEIVVYKPDQIKSVFNNGNFSRETSMIYGSIAPGQQPHIELTTDMFTKDGSSEDKITSRIKQLYDTATKNPDKTYLVPFKRNTPGIKQQGAPRLTMTRLSELFSKFPIPENVKFDPTFQGLMSVTPTSILNSIFVTPPTLIPIDAQVLKENNDRNFLKMRDDYGNPTGTYFSYEKQQEAIDSVVYLIYNQYLKGQTSVQDIRNAVEQKLKASLGIFLKIASGKKVARMEDVTKEIAENRVKEFQHLINSFFIKGDDNNLWHFAIKRLQMYGLNIYGFQSEEDSRQLVDKNDGTALRDYRDSSFELDRKDTASSRIKLFLSSIEDSEDRRTVRMSFNSALVREQVLSGEKNTTIRTPEVAQELGLKKGESAMTLVDGRMIKVTSLGPITSREMETYSDVATSEGIDLKPGMVAYSLQPITDGSRLAVHKNYLGLPKLINFEDTYQKLMALLSDEEPSLKNFMSLMYQSPDPVIRRVAERLDKETDQVKNEFVSVMSNQYQQFSMVLFGKELGRDGITRMQTRTIMANYSSQLNVILRNWEQLQKQAPIALRDAVGNLVINKEIAMDLGRRLALINAGQDEDKIQLFKDVLKAQGIDLPIAFFESFVKNVQNFTKGTRLQGNFDRQFAFNKDGSPAGLISAMVARLNGQITTDEEEGYDNSFQVNNPMYTEGTAMNILARAAMQFVPMVYSNTHRSSEGKSIYDHGLNTSLSHKVRRLKSDPVERQKYAQTYINEHNPLLVALNSDPTVQERFQVTYMDGLKPDYIKGSSGTSRSDMSFREQLLYSLALFEKRGNKKLADYISLTHSDKTTSPVFLNAPRITLVTGVKMSQGPTGPIRTQAITDETYKALWALFLDEYNRISKAGKIFYNADQFDKGKKFFYAMPEFNHDQMKKLMERGIITKEEFNGLWTDLGALKPVETVEAKRVLLKLFNRRIDTLTDRTLQAWKNEGLLTEDSVPFSLRYMNRLLYGVGIRGVETTPGVFDYVTMEGQPVNKTEAVKIAGLLAARDYAVNHFVYNVAASRLLYGDPAEVFKGDIPTTLVEYSKRLAKDIAPGKDGEWSHSPQYTAVTVEDWEGPASEVQHLVSAYGEGVNATDAQELITVQEYLDGKLAVGQISKQVYDEMSKIIADNRGKYYEFTKPEHQLAMVPQKPVYVGEGNLENGVILTHYIKSSAYPLLPSYTSGKQLDALRVAMENNGIARLNFKSTAKMGRPAAKIKLFAKDGSMHLSVLQSPEFTGKDAEGKPVPSARQTLDRKGFRIQQEIPHDPDKQKIGIVTQMNTLITQGIATINTPFTYQGNQVTAQALMEAKSAIRQAVFDLKRDEVLGELGMVDGELKDFDKLYDSLLDEASSRPGYTLNDIELLRYRDKKGQPLMPMIFSPSRSRFESLLMNKIGSMIDMKMYGHSFVQASSAGLKNIRTELTPEEKKRVVFVGDYRGGDLQTIRHDSQGNVRGAQVLVPFSFFNKGKKLNVQDFIITDENGYQVIDTQKLPLEFLQMIGARIPNTGHSSMLPIEIAGFLPDEMADTIIVPAAITKQMGSDFDVDKLFTYQRPYDYKQGTITSHEGYEDKLLNAYFDVHWSVLTHPEMTKQILSPLDKPDLEMEARKVPVPSDSDYFDVVDQLQSFQSQKFAKQLVGFTALTVTSNTTFEPLNVTLGRNVFNDQTGETENQPYSLRMVDPDGQVHELDRFSGYGKSINYDLDGAERTKHDNIVIVLSGFLDHAKNPVTPQINLNLYTYNAAAALLRIQSARDRAVGIPELASFLRQPIIMEYAQRMSAGNDSLSETFESDLHAKVMEDLWNKYKDLAGEGATIEPAEINLQKFRDNLTTKDTKAFYQDQLKALNLFDILWKAGRQLADVQGAFNWSVGGPGPSIITALSKETAIDDARVASAMPDNIVINNLEDMYHTEQGYIRDKLFEGIKDVALKVFPYDNLLPLMDQFKQVTGNTFMSPKLQQALIDGYLAYQWTTAPVWETDKGTISDRVRLFYSGQHGPSLAKRVQDAKISWGRNNYLLQRLEANLTTSGAGPDFINYTMGLSTGFDAAEVARSWNDILLSEDESRKRLGEDLVRYAILTGNSSTLARHIPVSYILGTSLLKATEQLKDTEAVSQVFLEQFLQHYPQYSRQLSVDLKETGVTYEQYPESFKVLPVRVEDTEHPGRKLWLKTPEGNYEYPAFLSYRDTTTNRWVLYKKSGYLNYQRIDTLGNSQIDEYSPAQARSILPENKAYQMEEPEAKKPAPGNIFDEHGMPKEGGLQEVFGMLDAIKNTETEPTLYRQLAGQLTEMNRNAEQHLLETATGGVLPEFKYEITDKLPPGLDAEMQSTENKLLISTKIDPLDFSKTLIHEMIHYHTAAVATIMEVDDNLSYYRSRYTNDTLEALRKLSRQTRAQMSDVYEKVKALSDIRKQAMEQLRLESKLGNAWDEVYENAIEGNISDIPSELQHTGKLIYALGSNAEFLSHIFTDRDTMVWLNNRKANVEKSIWDHVVDAISSIMMSVAEFLGVGVEKGSLLEEGVKRTMDLMQMEKNISPLTTKGLLDINPEAFRNSSVASASNNVGNHSAKKIATILARLEDQRREIRQTFTGTITKEQAARKNKLLDDLDKEIEQLRGEQDLTLVAEVGKKQLKWVNDIMARKDKNANDIMVADRVLELWTNLIQVMYGDNKNLSRIDEEWSKIAADAQVKRQELTNQAIEAIIQESKGTLTRRDFLPKELEDPGWMSVRIRGLSSAAKSKAVQYVATYMEQTGRMVNEEVLRTLKETKQLEDDFLKYAGSKSNLKEVYNKLMQENKTGTAWGLVKLYSPSWYGFISDTKAKREHRLDVINRDKSLSAKQKADMKRVAWQDYWKQIDSQAAMVDTRLFFDEQGNDHTNQQQALQQLIKDVGEEQATKVVEKARQRYKQYLDEKETFTDMMQADVLSGTKTQEEADREVQAWIGKYSPNVFFNNFRNNFSVFNVNNTDRFVVTVPKQQYTKYFDKKFQSVKSDPKLYELYNRLHDVLLQMRSYLPKSLQYDLGENFLPVVAKNLLHDISSLPDYITGVPDAFIRSLTATAQEESDKGRERIPISYVNTSKEKDPAEIAKRSRDLVKITELFAAMAIHYKHFANAKDVIDMGQSIIREIDRNRMRDGKIVDEQGRVLSAPQGLKNALDALQYMKEYVMFKKAKALEGNSNIKIYSKSPKEQIRISNRVKELIIEREKLTDKLLSGDIDGEVWKEKTKDIDAELAKYDGLTIYGSKVGDKLISIQQAKTLSFNPFSGIANFTFGVVSAAIFANGRQEFGNTEFRRALRILMSSTGKYLSFGAHTSDQAMKIMNIMDRLGVMGDVVESQYGKLEYRQRTPGWKKNLSPYNWLRSGDYFCRGLNTVATLLKHQVKVQTAEGEKTISMWEALDSEGKWNEKLYGKRPEWFSEKVEDQTEWNKLRDKVARVNMAIMGNVDHVSPKMANKWILGRLLGQFRLSWLPEGWYNRWAEEKYDIQAGRYTKGRFTTYKDLGVGGSLKVLFKQFASIVSKVDPFTGQYKMNGQKMSDADIENMRKNFAELNFYLLVVGAVMMIRGLAGGGKDDDDSQESLHLLVNMILRTKQDISFYSSPEVFDTVTRNAVPAFDVIKDYGKFMDASWKVMTDDDYTADKWALKMTHAGLPIPQAALVNKIKYMSTRDLDSISR